MMPIRKVQTATHFRVCRGPSRNDPSVIVDDLMTPCEPQDPGAVEMRWEAVSPDKLLESPVTTEDLLRSLKKTRPTVNSEDLGRFEDFTRDFGLDG